jgi:hypothetical protein
MCEENKKQIQKIKLGLSGNLFEETLHGQASEEARLVAFGVFFLCRVDLLIDGKGIGSRNEFHDNLTLD